MDFKGNIDKNISIPDGKISEPTFDIFDCTKKQIIGFLSKFEENEIKEIINSALELKKTNSSFNLVSKKSIQIPKLPHNIPPPPPTSKYIDEQIQQSFALDSGFFIVVEGIDGCGKDTLVDKLYSYLVEEHKLLVHKTSEPSKGEFGRLLRIKLKESIPSIVDALLFALDRADHCFSEIIPHLKNKQVIISSRYRDSSIAYQTAQGLPFSWIEKINSLVIEPHIVILLDIDPKISLARRYKDTPPENREKFEEEEFLSRVRNNYLRIVANNVSKTKYAIINAEQSIDKVFNDTISFLKPFLTNIKL